MPVIQGLSDGDEVPRLIEVEPRGADVWLWVHPAASTRSGQDILVPRAELTDALRRGEGRVAGVSPVRRTPKVCEVERRPEGLLVKVHPESGKGSWWVTVPAGAVEAALGEAASPQPKK